MLGPGEKKGWVGLGGLGGEGRGEMEREGRDVRLIVVRERGGGEMIRIG